MKIVIRKNGSLKKQTGMSQLRKARPHLTDGRELGGDAFYLDGAEVSQGSAENVKAASLCENALIAEQANP